jgi:hypothetical protein
LSARGLLLALTVGASGCTEDWDFAFGGGVATGGGPAGPACSRAADCDPPLVCCAGADGRDAQCEATCSGVVLQCAGPTDCVSSLCCAWALDAPVTGTECADTCGGVELCTPTMNDCSDGVSSCAPHPVLEGSYCAP